jgi:serine/threonine protein kinase
VTASAEIPDELRDRLQPLAVLGQGTAGRVFRARDRELDREVVVKVLRTETHDAPGMAARFRREARTLASLDHPRVLRLLDYGVIGTRTFTIHPFLPGRDLRRAMSSEEVDAARASAWLADAFEGLAYVHDQGVLHRDLKPENLFLDRDDRVVLIDFGLAKGSDDETLTRTDMLLGTPIYMAPELLCQSLWSPAADVYSLGVVAYELLTGTNPFRGKSLPETVTRHMDLVPPPPTQGREPMLDALVMSLLSKLPEERPSADSARDELRDPGPPTKTAVTSIVPPALEESPPAPSEPPRRSSSSPGLATACVLSASLVAAWLLAPSTPPPAAPAPPSSPPASVPSRAAVPAALRDLPAMARSSLDELFDAHGRDPDWGDPEAWEKHEARVEGPARMRRWLEDGGRLRDLPPEFRRQLATLDADAYGLGALPIFGPLASATPSPPDLGFEATLLDHRPRPEWVTDTRSTWRGAALTALGKAVAAATHAKEILARSNAPDSQLPEDLRGYLPEAGIARAISDSRGYHFDRVSLAGPAARRALALWIRDGVRSTQDFWFNTARSLRTEKQDLWLAHQVARWTHSLVPLFFSQIAYMPVEDLMGLDPDHPAEAIVALEILIRQARVRRNAGRIDPTFTARYREIWTRAMRVARITEATGHGRQLVLKRLVQTPVDLVSREQWGDLLDVAVRELRDRPREVRVQAAQVVATYVAKKDDRSEFPDIREHLATLNRP